MIILWLIILLLAVVITGVFIEPVHLSFLLDTDKMDMHAKASWTRAVRLEAKIVDYRLFITVCLFGKTFIARFVRKAGEQKSKTDLYKALSLSDPAVRISWGLSEPALTGIFYAAAEFAGALIKNVGIELEPDFVPDREFLSVGAEADLNIGKTAVNLMKLKLTKRRKNYGSTEPY